MRSASASSTALPAEDAALVVWLVEHHLTMSQTAQKQDLSDPARRRDVRAQVDDERRLTALYLLTVADIRGTSPKVWNAWKAKLLEDLFHATRAALARRRATHAARQRRSSASAKRSGCCGSTRCRTAPSSSCGASSTRRTSSATPPTRSRGMRATCTGASMARHRWSRHGSRAPAQACRCSIYLPDQKELFARICGFFGRSGLSILEAKVHTTRHGYALDTFAVHDPTIRNASYRETIQFVEHELTRVLTTPAPLDAARRRPHLRASCATSR